MWSRRSGDVCSRSVGAISAIRASGSVGCFALSRCCGGLRRSLERLGDPAYVKSLGLVGHNLLGAEKPGRLAWSVMLYERGAERNYLHIHADSLNSPFDINSGAKLILGSTAKLRTLKPATEAAPMPISGVFPPLTELRKSGEGNADR